MDAMENKCWYMIYSAAETLTEIKKSELDEPIAKELHELINKDESIDAHYQQQQQEQEVDEVVENGVDQNIVAFGVNEEFIRKLNCGEIRMESLSLPNIGRGIDECILPRLPPIDSLHGKIGICSPPFEKQLTTTDLKMDQGKVTFGKLPVEGRLLPMLKEGEDVVEGINVTVYNERGEGFPMCFTFWSNKLYVLKSGWNKFAKENELRSLEDWITVWMFRHNDTDELCFAIIPRRFPITMLLKSQKKKR